jgi:hypothetical protein
MESELALALALPKNDATADPARALVSVGDAVGRAGTLELPVGCLCGSLLGIDLGSA